MWINTTTKAVYRLHTEIRSSFPDVSMPSDLSEAVIESLGLAPVIQEDKPSGYVVEACPPELIDGVWKQGWIVRPPTASETDAEAAQVRIKRNRLLSECDWTQVADAPVDQGAWAAYRQQLRDISGQSGFPFEVVWPTEPVAGA